MLSTYNIQAQEQLGFKKFTTKIIFEEFNKFYKLNIEGRGAIEYYNLRNSQFQ